ncbi:hypothetical protein SCHPADRAFT_462824 [Schizopora paradoxa]|uniref:Uncharacterized protein n=1 Tax=Schizopora paradoxa TaxID=27342 RepID=A0A0H2RIZ6_9AGAM|nr:hypothetical protein SCHPADRAFT_462824 [Schizopora paradoxa]
MCRMRMCVNATQWMDVQPERSGRRISMPRWMMLIFVKFEVSPPPYMRSVCCKSTVVFVKPTVAQPRRSTTWTTSALMQSSSVDDNTRTREHPHFVGLCEVTEISIFVAVIHALGFHMKCP